MGRVARMRLPSGLLAGAVAIAAATALQAPGVAMETAAAQAMASKAAEDDYYTRRARKVLEAERAAMAKPHPLAASYPGKNIVVCEAGCPDRTPQVVFVRPEIPETVETSEGMMMPTASSDGRPVPTDQVACIAGCYGAGPAAEAANVVANETPQSNLLRSGISVEDWTPPVRERKTIDDKLSPVR